MTIKFPNYSYHVKVIITDNIPKAYYRIFKESYNYEHEEIGGLHMEDDSGTSYIFLPKEYDAGVVAHECYHAVMALFRWIGVEKYDEELIAYHLQYLVSKIKLN